MERNKSGLRCLELAFRGYAIEHTYVGVQAVRTLRATQLESIFGLDCVVPNTKGAARVAGWWSPSRKEAMMELRLF